MKKFIQKLIYRMKWGKAKQLRLLLATLQEDARWLASDPIARPVIARYLALAQDGWEKAVTDEIAVFRARIGLDPWVGPAKERHERVLEFRAQFTVDWRDNNAIIEHKKVAALHSLVHDIPVTFVKEPCAEGTVEKFTAVIRVAVPNN